MDDIVRPTPAADEDDADTAALAAAVQAARDDPRGIPHEEMRQWLLKIANGAFDAPPPVPRMP